MAALAILACSGGPELTSLEDTEYNFGAEQMAETVTGEWTGTWTAADGSVSPLALTLSRPASAAREPLCTNRTFSALGARNLSCIVTSEMLLDGLLDLGTATPQSLTLAGSFVVLGRTLDAGDLSLRSGDLTLAAAYTSGTWHDCSVRQADAPLASCTLDARR
jgi:hypothetical protein